MVEQENIQQNLSVYQTEMLNRMMLASRMGLQFSGARDIYSEFGYPLEIQPADYWSRYKRQDIAKAIINRPIKATWTGTLAINYTAEESEQLKNEYEALEKELTLKNKFQRLDKLTALGRYGVLLLGFNDVVYPQTDFPKPVMKSGRLKLLYVTPLSEVQAKIHSWEDDPTNKRYNQPKLYQVEFPSQTGQIQTFRVHYSRVLHVTGELLDSEVYGTPVLEDVWNRLMDLEKLVGGSAEMYWLGARPGIAGKVDKDFSIPDGFKETVDDQLKEFQHGLRRVLLNEGVDFTTLAQQYHDPKSALDVQITMISVVTGIPKRVLMGSERGELSSSQDDDTWNDLITTRREEFAEAKIIKPFVERMMEFGILSAKPEFTVEWVSMFVVSDKDKAEVGKARATALKEYTSNPAASSVVPPEAFYKYFLGLSDAQIDDIWAIQAELQDMQPDDDLEFEEEEAVDVEETNAEPEEEETE